METLLVLLISASAALGSLVLALGLFILQPQKEAVYRQSN